MSSVGPIGPLGPSPEQPPRIVGVRLPEGLNAATPMKNAGDSFTPSGEVPPQLVNIKDGLRGYVSKVGILLASVKQFGKVVI